jgi:hypothetical protein
VPIVPASNRRARCGAVTFVQRFGDALNLNLHLHTLALDGIYLEDDEGCLAFRHVAPPSDGEVAWVARRVHRRVVRLLGRRGLGPEAGFEEADDLRRNQPLLAELYGASVSNRVAAGPHAGRRVARAGDVVDPGDRDASPSRRCASVEGFSVHADVCLPAHDRFGLERLCHYTGRPPVATERLSLLPDGRLLYRLRRRWRDGTRHVIFEPLDLVARLAALVPPPRFHLVRYHGVLAPSAGFRPLIVPESQPPASPGHSLCPVPGGPAPRTGRRAKRGGCRPRNYPWADLLRRVFAADVLECPRCHSRMRILCAVHPPEAIRKILECLGIPSRPPPIARASGIDDATDLAPAD